jgi:hypothetical protein
MRTALLLLVRWLLTTLRRRASLQLEVLPMRHQLSIYQRTCRRPRISPADRILWSYLAGSGPAGASTCCSPSRRTVLAWQRTRFRDHWRVHRSWVSTVPIHSPCNRQSSGRSSSFPMSAASNITTSGGWPNRTGEQRQATTTRAPRGPLCPYCAPSYLSPQGA